MGIFSSGGVGNAGAAAAVSMLSGLAGTGVSGLGMARQKPPSKTDMKQRGVAASFILGRHAKAGNLETDGMTLKVGGEVLASRSFGRNGPRTVKICVPSNTKGKRAVVNAANSMLRTIKAGVKVGTSREGDSLMFGANKRRGGGNTLFFPDSCVEVKLTQPMVAAANDEIAIARQFERTNGKPPTRAQVKAWRRNRSRLNAAIAKQRKAEAKAARNPTRANQKAAATAAAAVAKLTNPISPHSMLASREYARTGIPARGPFDPAIVMVPGYRPRGPRETPVAPSDYSESVSYDL